MLINKFTTISIHLLFLSLCTAAFAMEEQSEAIQLVTHKRAMLTTKKLFAQHAQAIKDQGKVIDTLRQQLKDLKQKRKSALMNMWRSYVYKKVADCRKSKCNKLAKDHAVEVQKLEQKLSEMQSKYNQETVDYCKKRTNDLGQINELSAQLMDRTLKLQKAQADLMVTTRTAKIQLQQEQTKSQKLQEDLTKAQKINAQEVQQLQAKLQGTQQEYQRVKNSINGYIKHYRDQCYQVGKQPKATVLKHPMESLLNMLGQSFSQRSLTQITASAEALATQTPLRVLLQVAQGVQPGTVVPLTGKQMLTMTAF